MDVSELRWQCMARWPSAGAARPVAEELGLQCDAINWAGDLEEVWLEVLIEASARGRLSELETRVKTPEDLETRRERIVKRMCRMAEAYAEAVRQEVLLPFCKKHGVTYKRWNGWYCDGEHIEPTELEGWSKLSMAWRDMVVFRTSLLVGDVTTGDLV